MSQRCQKKIVQELPVLDYAKSAWLTEEFGFYLGQWFSNTSLQTFLIKDELECIFSGL